MEFLLMITAAIHFMMCPFTKVEESFNLQAIHDLIYWKADISKYDHLEFPGVVPRSFVGPLCISVFSTPSVTMLSLVDVNKFYSQYIVRGVLSYLVILAFQRFVHSVRKIFGNFVANWCIVITISQFHFLFYLSRPLPNIFALVLVLLAYHYWLENECAMFIWSSAASIIIFRSELAILLGLVLLTQFQNKTWTFSRVFKHCIAAGITTLALTVAVDSIFWQRLVWPEGEVFWFNVIKNKSSEWGTSPFFWYFYSAIPRGMACSVCFLPYGFAIDKRVRALLLPALAFVALYSFLPHKELRFIIYVFPLLNIAVARACHQLWTGKTKSTIKGALALSTCSHILMNFMFTSFLLYVSTYNYPGGNALRRLHSLEPASSKVNVHIDVYSAETGVSRFLELNPNWRYSKAENLIPGSAEMLDFTHLLVEARTHDSHVYEKSHDVLDIVECFSHIKLSINEIPFLQIHKQKCVFILRRKPGIQAKILPPRMPSKSI